MRCARRLNCLRRLSAVVIIVMLIAGCASRPPANDLSVIPNEELYDPIEPVNRVIFDLNEHLDALVARPASKLYRTLLPGVVRVSVRSFLRNLTAPVIFINDVLQGENEQARTTVTRVVINTTIGVGGLFDVASDMGHPYHKADFGQTLSVYGSGEGIYLVLPILGPSTTRDAIGSVVDIFLNPLTYVAPVFDAEGLLIGRRVLDGVDARSRNDDELDKLKRDAIDFYALVRNLYRQRRQFEIRNSRERKELSAPALSQQEIEERRVDDEE